MKRLYRSKSDQMICGVCGGIAEYLGVDPTVVRLVWAIFSAFAGTGLLLYILAAVVMPSEDRVR